jgi:hypothetical protein
VAGHGGTAGTTSGSGGAAGSGAGGAAGSKGGTGGTGTGGIATGGTGGSAGAGGSTGGASGTSGATGGSMGTGGCMNGNQQCSGGGYETCSSGQWGAVTPCGSRQACHQNGNTSQCACTADPVCNTTGSFCGADNVTLTVCGQDTDGCYYKSSSSACTSGGCNGSAGQASCCTSTCSLNVTQCATGTSLATCQASGGCNIYFTSSCGTGLVCERVATPSCADPQWAAWPMPNSLPDTNNGAPHPQGYTDNGDGTVTDKVTGLMWQQGWGQAATGMGFNWTQAISYCQGLTLANHDWRVPTMIELVSIIDYNVPTASDGSVPLINATLFPSTPAADFWTYTTQAATPTAAWVVHFQSGSVIAVDKTLYPYVRCVR